MNRESEADAAALEAGRKLFAGPCIFVRGVADMANLPSESLAEVAFAGRSNVGKSSLVNALTGRRTLARTSNTPGRTREINFFRLGAPPQALMLVDLPGYGYARASKREVAAWTALVRDYLKGRPNLRRVLLLVDARHGLKNSDREVMAILDAAAVSYQIVLTKADKLKEAERVRILAATAAAARGFTACHPDVHLTSAVKGRGIEALRTDIARLVHA